MKPKETLALVGIAVGSFLVAAAIVDAVRRRRASEERIIRVLEERLSALTPPNPATGS